MTKTLYCRVRHVWAFAAGWCALAVCGCSSETPGGGIEPVPGGLDAGGLDDSRGGDDYCRPDCSVATCQNPKDTCGGECPGVCANESGCKYDVHCQPGYACVHQDQTTTCLPADCLGRVLVPPLCGLPGAKCGEKCPPCTPTCDGRMCGPDPSCGESCGTCGTGESCNGFGQCVPPSCDPPIFVPDGDGGMRPVGDLDASGVCRD
jgi:hypothetical protein